MNSPTTPREINRRIFLNLHQDGILDMLGGSIVLTFGLIPILDSTPMGPGLRQVLLLGIYFIEILAVILLKNHITFPRAGRVIMRPEKRKALSLTFLIVNIALFLLLAGSSLAGWSPADRLGQFRLPVLLGSLFLLLFSVSGVLLKAARFHAYGLLVLGAYLLSGFLYSRGFGTNDGIPAAAFSSGGIILFCGATLFILFLRKYKKVK